MSVPPTPSSRATAFHQFAHDLLMRLDARGVAIADTQGLLVAGASHAGNLEALGALAAVGHEVARRRPELVEDAAGGAHIHYAHLTTSHGELFVASAGGAPPAGPDIEQSLEQLFSTRFEG